ncbi:MAG: M20/M25/M40 family metallo-hydrolase [Bdellovibrionaceae bacterium]|nr:M20/M25/M40 family metallo-hydrolase [Pseudobdellovibrionaceae bacterium]
MEFLDACRKFIAIDSSPSGGTRELADFAGALCRGAGLNVEIQSETLNGVDQANIIARPGEAPVEGELMLQTHLDTVDPGAYALWTKTNANPFNASIYGDELYGLGASDVKLDFLCKLQAIKEIGIKMYRLPPVLVGTFGEELGMAGAVRLIRKKKIAARRALVGEPTEMRLIHAMKGLAQVEIEIPFPDEERNYRAQHDLGESTSTQSKIFTGRSAHSSNPDLGESAILKMLEYLAKLPEGLAVMSVEGGVNFNTVPSRAMLEIDLVGGLRENISRRVQRVMNAIAKLENDFTAYSDSSFVPPRPTLNIGMIRTFQDHVKMLGCCRLPPVVSNETYEGWMREIRDACESVGGAFRITDYKQPYRTSPDAEFVRVCQGELQRLGRDGQCATQSATNEANVFSRFGMECVVIGAGQGVGNSHTPNEHVKISQLQEAIRFYKGVVSRVCL